MDIFTHAVTGAATGYFIAQRPILGAVVAILPDVSLWFTKRKKYPDALYLFLHSLFPLIITTTLDEIFLLNYLLTFCYLSHIALDFITHGPDWAPRLIYPINNVKVRFFEEWEFFNYSWFIGLFYAFVWVLLVYINWN